MNTYIPQADMQIPTTAGRVQRAGLDVAAELAAWVENEALSDTDIEHERFWQGFAEIIADLAPINRALLGERDRLQAQIDLFHAEQPGQPDPATYRAFLERIGYLLPEPDEFTVVTDGLDDEIARMAGPQLVVPLLNARFAVNAANARWGSLYDSLYGTDAIPDAGETRRGDVYNPVRGVEVVRRGRDLLDEIAPLVTGSHHDVTGYRVLDGILVASSTSGQDIPLRDPAAFAGYTGAADDPASVLLVHHGLHADVIIDRDSPVGSTDIGGIADIVLESAITTIMDLEDSVAAVDAADKVLGYRNWRELMLGTLSEQLTKNGAEIVRTMNPDREYVAPDGSALTLPGRSLLLVRNVGHLMTTDAVRDSQGAEAPEGIVDALMTSLGAYADLTGRSTVPNSRTGSLYIVKPKMHGPEEVVFAATLFARVEELLGLPSNSLKIGIMDEERRTTVNLRACIFAARERVVFINTGFLDRTGDEIHTSLRAGVMVPKGRMREQPFIAAYERANVDAGLSAGMLRRGQIGKGMWAMPDLMHDMLDQKVAHVRAGATTAWVPSPTAATLHALHYHQLDAFAIGEELASRARQSVDEILVLPLASGPLSREVVKTELDNNVQSILGYVVRWIDQGVGCSKVPDIHGVALMEDRATLRISSQLLANWLAHGVITEAEVDESLDRLAPIVDAQNAGDSRYEELIARDGPGMAYQAARRLIVEGAAQPSGYTEPLLHSIRRQKKAKLAR